MADVDAAQPVAPIFIGPANCQLVLGLPWRWTRDTARRLGVPVLRVASKPLIRAAELQAALEREAMSAQPAREVTYHDELAARRAALGMERRA